MSVQRPWNLSAKMYDRKMGDDGDSLNAKIIRPQLLKMLGDTSLKNILDVGCGSGYLTAELAQHAKEVTGIDFSREFIKLCREKCADQPNLNFLKHDIAKPFTFTDGSFDIVLSKMVLQYVSQISNFIKESFRILKSAGQLVIAIDHPFHAQFYYAQSLVGQRNHKYMALEDYFSHHPQIKTSLWGKAKLTWYPRTVADYIQPFIGQGFQLKEIKELAETKNDITLPRILLLKFRK